MSPCVIHPVSASGAIMHHYLNDTLFKIKKKKKKKKKKKVM